MMSNMLKMAGMKPEDCQKMANDAGLNVPENAFEKMMQGDFSGIKSMDWSKAKGKGSGYMKKRAHFVSGTDPEIVYLLTPRST